MAKFKPGIPQGFSFDVKPVQDLGDYLDEPGPMRAQQRGANAARRELEPLAGTPPVPVRGPVEVPPVVSPSRPAARLTVTVSPPPPASQTASNAVGQELAGREERGGRPKAPRREISMTPDTLRMSDELLDMIRSGSGQRDTKANELIHALVLLVYEARDELDTHTIPKRGRWGTPTARAYPLELKNAFLQALLKKYANLTESPTGLKYPVNSAA